MTQKNKALTFAQIRLRHITMHKQGSDICAEQALAREDTKKQGFDICQSLAVSLFFFERFVCGLRHVKMKAP